MIDYKDGWIVAANDNFLYFYNKVLVETLKISNIKQIKMIDYETTAVLTGENF